MNAVRRFGARHATWLMLAVAVLGFSAWSAGTAIGAAQARAWTVLSCAGANDDALAFAMCDRSAHMHAVCDGMASDVRGHCERCFAAGHALPCGDDTRCRAVELAVATCLDAKDRSVDVCQGMAYQPATPRHAQPGD